MKALLLTVLGILIPSVAFAADAPQSFTYQGRIFLADGVTAEEGAAVTFKVQIYSPDGQCLLFEETHQRDMTNSDGVFSLLVGLGTSTNVATLTLPQVVDNLAAKTGAAACAYAPISGDSRRIRLSYNDGSGYVTLPTDQNINSVPYALYAQSLGGYTADKFLQVNNTTTTQANIDLLAQYSAQIVALATGTSTNYINQNYSDSNLGGKAINSTAVSNITNGQTLVWNTVQNDWTTATPTSGTVTSVAAGTGLTGGPITSAGTISLANFGTAGTYYKVTTDATGRVQSGSTTLSDSDLPATISTAGKVSGNAITTGTIGGNTIINTSGNVTAANVSATSVTSNSVRVYEATNTHKVTISAPVGLSADLNLTLPGGNGSSGQFLTTDGNGTTSWASIAAPTAASITGTLTASQLPIVPISNGGTGLSSVGSPNQFIGMNTAGTGYEYKTVSAGTGLTATPSVGGLSISISAGGVTSTELASNSVTTAKAFVNPGINRMVMTDGTTGANLVGFGCAASQLLTWNVTTGWSCTNQNTLTVGSATNFTGALVGDVTGTQGVTAVATVGGSTAANIHTAEQLANGATSAASANTIVKRDGSGNIALNAASLPNFDYSKITSGKPTTISGYGITDAVQNLGGVSSEQAGLSTALPAAGIAGRVFYETDLKQIVRDSGSSWDVMGTSAASSLTGTLNVSVLPTVTVAKGGTGLTALGAANQILGVNATGTSAEYKTLSAGTGITMTNAIGSITAAVNVGTGASQIVQLDTNAKLPAVDGSALTNLPVSAYANMTVFNATGNFTVPANVTRVYVQVWGAGGGGGGGLLTIGGGGGGGGAYGNGIVSVTPNSVVSIIVGAAGTAAASGNNAGGNGGQSSFGTAVVAGGGAGGSASTSQTIAAAGTSTSGMFVNGSAGSIGTILSVALGGGNGGNAGGGGGYGGTGASNGSSAGSAGGVPGGGGGGGGGTPLSIVSGGGAGAAGRVVVWY